MSKEKESPPGWSQWSCVAGFWTKTREEVNFKFYTIYMMLKSFAINNGDLNVFRGGGCWVCIDGGGCGGCASLFIASVVGFSDFAQQLDLTCS